MKNIKLTLSYDGTRYFGWQKAKNGPTIEQTLEKLLERLLSHPIALQAASRTDRGVHALEQVCNFFTSKECALDDLKRSLNSLLPSDIAILNLELASDHFHPTLDAKGKEYLYRICTDRSLLPFHQNFAWYYPYPLCLETMRQAAHSLLGKRDFSSFCNQRKDLPAEKTREIETIEITQNTPSEIYFSIRGTHFLYKMVRTIVGTLAEIGRGKIDPASLPNILDQRDRKQAGMTAPAKGLTLHRIFY
jgi:tRNA pseudouridine38-40 synthase